ncbi:hypothetical protein VKT23_006321 [Stygiomarasmius scandens]|uniref:Uncharacterized protein n=1 Tax=Marasmiellus scandens TaxID=2682957 RepID=A0ABR1JMH8_9AGAR
MSRDSGLSNRSKRIPSFVRESSIDESDPLFKQRKASLVPFTRSPFIVTSKQNLKSGELAVDVAEVVWSDLLLEIAMTTAFASLTDGTPILDPSNLSSYLSFFALVWWVWASQVAYNVRFRQADWLHRVFVFFQVFVFCSLAAFTNNFDITNGIKDNSAEERQISLLESAALENSDLAQPLIDVQEYRDDRLPTLNVRGISMTMAFSRLLLLAQYMMAFYHKLREDKKLVISKHSAFLVHIVPLLFSSVCFFAAFGVVGKSPDKGDQIAKLVLWYFPLLIEVAAHFIAISRFCGGRVRYNADSIFTRSSTVFIIILGGGLDKITNGFQYIVGNISMGWESLGLLICGVLIFILLFSLYFGSSEPEKVGNKRAISVFFFQFFYLAAVIVTLQGIAAMLRAGNIGDAITETPLNFYQETKQIMDLKGFGVNITLSDYQSLDLAKELKKQGVPLETLLFIINTWSEIAVWRDDQNLPHNALLQTSVIVIQVVLGNLNNFPDSGLLMEELDAFTLADVDNYDVINDSSFKKIVQDIIISNATPALWFYAAGGSVLVTLGLMSLIRQWPRDRYEWGQIISRILMGSAIISFSAIDVNASDNVLKNDWSFEGSRIWYLATHSWVLPPYALALLIEQIVELVLLNFAGRNFGEFGSSVLNRSLSRAVYTRAGTSDYDSFGYGSSTIGIIHDDPASYFDPQSPYDVDTKELYTKAELVTSPPVYQIPTLHYQQASRPRATHQ